MTVLRYLLLPASSSDDAMVSFDDVALRTIYNFNSGHEFWFVSPHSLISKFDDASFPLFLGWSFAVESVLLAGGSFLFLKAVSLVTLEQRRFLEDGECHLDNA